MQDPNGWPWPPEYPQQQDGTYPWPYPDQPWQGAPYDPQYYLHMEGQAANLQHHQVHLHCPLGPGWIPPGPYHPAHPQYRYPAPPLPARGSELSSSQEAWRTNAQTQAPTWPASTPGSPEEHSNEVEANAAGGEGVDEQASREAPESLEKKRGDNKDAQAQNAGTTEGESAMTAVYCKACQTWLNGPRQWNDHRIGKKHRKNEAKQRRREASCSKDLAQNKEPIRPPELDLWTKGENETADWLNSAAEELLCTRDRGGDCGALESIPESPEKSEEGKSGFMSRKSRRERKQESLVTDGR